MLRIRLEIIVNGEQDHWSTSEPVYVGRRAMEMKVGAYTGEGREEYLREDAIKEKGLSADEVYDRATWRHYVIVHRPHIKK